MGVTAIRACDSPPGRSAVGNDVMSQAVKAQEPSMEEILASIRRIIADDDAAKPAEPAAKSAPPLAAVPPPAPAAAEQDKADTMLAKAPEPAPGADVLDLTESMTAPPAEPAPSFRTIEAGPDVVFTDRAPEPPEAPAARMEEAPARMEEPRRQYVQAAEPDRALVSRATAAAVDSAFNSLAQTVLGNNARTLEDLVKEMLRPMLKSWLDDNLPNLVERIVRDEIERVSRGRH
jgi:cell pole-organizing protein PopZ